MAQVLEFAGNHPLLVGAAVMLAALILINEIRLRARAYREVSPAEAVQLINADALVVDVREPGRYGEGHIVGARNIPLERLEEEAGEKLAKRRDKPVLVCCDDGIGGGRAATLLNRLGFAQVFNLRGGLGAWRQENYPLENAG